MQTIEDSKWSDELRVSCRSFVLWVGRPRYSGSGDMRRAIIDRRWRRRGLAGGCRLAAPEGVVKPARGRPACRPSFWLVRGSMATGLLHPKALLHDACSTVPAPRCLTCLIYLSILTTMTPETPAAQCTLPLRRPQHPERPQRHPAAEEDGSLSTRHAVVHGKSGG